MTGVRDGNRWQQIFVALLVALAFVGTAAAISSYLDTSGETVMINDGTQVNVTGDRDQNWETPYRDSDTVYVETPQNGNLSVESSGTVDMDVDATTLNNQFTNVSNISHNGNEITLGGSKRTVRFSGATHFEHSDYVVDDNTVDFKLSASSTTTLNLTGFSTGDAVIAVNGTGAYVDGNSSDGGEVDLAIPSTTDTVRLISNGNTRPTFSDPAPIDRTDDFPSQIAVNVTDSDFPDDELDVEIELDGVTQKTTTVTSESRVTTPISPGRGTFTVTATATDATGKQTVESWTFSTPQNLTVRRMTDPNGILDNRRVNATFFHDGEITEKTTTNGNISMDGLPIEDNIVVTLSSGQVVNNEEYIDNEALVLDFTEQQDVYMLNEVPLSSGNVRDVRFTLTDRTGGQFSDSDVVVAVQKPLDHGGNLSDTEYRTVYADRVGPEGATATLEDGQRYRVVVRNDQNDRRVLGSYQADDDEIVELSVGQISVGPDSGGDDVTHNVTYDDSGATPAIRVRYNDTATDTDRIHLKIYEFNNESNVLVRNQSFNGDFGTYSFDQQLNPTEANKTWAVELRAERPGDNIAITKPVGDGATILPGIPERLKILISIGSIILVAGLFSQINGHFGGLAVAGLGGIFYFVGFLPDGVDIGIVILAMSAAGLIFVRERGATT